MGGDGGMKAPGRDYVKCKGMGFVNPKSTGMGSVANLVRTVSVEYMSDFKKQKVRMSFCRLTDAPLEAPIVACKLGHLYNKTAIIEYLLEKKMPTEYEHIRSLKDVKQCKVEWTKADSLAVGETAVAAQKGLKCPISMADISNSGVKSCIIWKTGVICSLKALKEMKTEKGICPVTGEKYEPEDIVELANTADEIEELRKKLPKAPPKKKQKVSNGDTPKGSEALALEEKARKLQGREATYAAVPIAGSSKITAQKEIVRAYGSTPGNELAEKVYQEALKTDSAFASIFTPRDKKSTHVRDGFGTPTSSGRK
jgi:hypothetical protein